MKIGDKVRIEKMAPDSFYQKAEGIVVEIGNGFVTIEATKVMSKYTPEWKERTNLSTSGKIEHTVLV